MFVRKIFLERKQTEMYLPWLRFDGRISISYWLSAARCWSARNLDANIKALILSPLFYTTLYKFIILLNTILLCSIVSRSRRRRRDVKEPYEKKYIYGISALQKLHLVVRRAPVITRLFFFTLLLP